MFTDEDVKAISFVKNCIKDALQDSGLQTLCVDAHVNPKRFIVTGGCFTSLLCGEKPKDFDLYSDDPTTGNTLKQYIMKSGLKYVEDHNPAYGATLVQGKLVTSNAITLKNKVQFVTRDTETAHAIRRRFDFEHCRPFYNLIDDKIYISELQYHLCKNKLLKRVEGVKSVTDRANKFLARGFKWYGYNSTSI